MKNILSSIASITTMLMLSAYATSAYAQTKTVSGTVFAEGKPVSGVVISQEGSNQTTITTNKGTYQIMVTGNAPVLIFRHPKYADYRLATTGAEHNIQLQPKENTIDEVVINAGYYKVKDRERTGSIAKVNSKDIENQPVTNVLSAVQGRVAGVNISTNGGTPGGGYQIQIRGQNSLRTIFNSGIDGNQPMYIVDGVPLGGEVASLFSGAAIAKGSINPLNVISPQDIESIEILKDADATSIYGSRGANGVVLITTKKGKSGKTRLSFNTMYSLSKTISNIELLNSEQYIGVRKQAYQNSGITTLPATAYDINGIWDQNRNTDWRRALIGNIANTTSTQLSLGGGSEATSFLLSINHQEQSTVYDADFKYRTIGISNSINHTSKDRLFKISISNLFSNQKNNVINEDITRLAYTLSPNAPSLYKNDGSLNWENNTFTNPLASYQAKYSYNNYSFINNFTSEYQIFRNIKLIANGGINYQNFEERSIRPNTIYNPAYVTGQSSFYSQSYKSNTSKFSYILEPQIAWNFKHANHEVNLLLGATYQSDQTNQGSIRGTSFESNAFIYNIAAAQTKTIGDQVQTQYKYAAAFNRLNYQYKKKYIINITARRDGSSRFGDSNKWASFVAIGAAWLFSNEEWLKDVAWLNMGKIRSSYGTTGSDNIGDFQYLDTFSVVPNTIYNGVTGIIPTKLYNPNYSWEKTKKFEIALDLSLFSNRLNFSTSYYQNRSSNQLVGYQLPAITGFTSVNANLNATVENKGWEVDASLNILKYQNINWVVGGNISFPSNKLLSFPGLEGSTYASSYIIGMPISIVKLYHLEGHNPQNGQYIFTDFNGDGKITSADDRQIIENIGVKYFGGVHNNFKYKNWEFSFLLQFVKQKIKNYNSIMTTPGSMNNLPVQVLDVWSPDNPNGYYMPYQATGSTLQTLFQNSDASVSDASFVRLKNVSLSYRIPLESNSIFRDARVYFQGQNLLTYTKYFGIDPETGSGSFLPPLRTFAFGIQFNL